MLFSDSNHFVANSHYNFVEMQGFGAWLRSHRTALKMLQSDVARRAGVSPSYVSTLEREQPHTLTGEVITPDREKVVALARAVEGDPDEALKLCGYAPVTPDQSYDVLEGVTVHFQNWVDLTPDEREKIMGVIRTLAIGIRNERGAGSS